MDRGASSRWIWVLLTKKSSSPSKAKATKSDDDDIVFVSTRTTPSKKGSKEAVKREEAERVVENSAVMQGERKRQY